LTKIKQKKLVLSIKELEMSKSMNSKLRTHRRLKVAVIGVGSMGRHHARNYAEIKGVDLVAVSDTDKSLGERVASEFNTKFYQDYNELLESEKPELVSIAVPTKWHFPVALDVIRSKTHTLIEKPIAFSINEAEEIILQAKKAKIKLTVGHIERFNPAILKLKDLIEKGKLGTIISVMARRAGTIPPRIKDANVILDIGVHDIDLINFILGRQPINVYASGGKAVLKKQEDYADILLEYPVSKEGLSVTGHIQVNWITPVKIRKINVTGTKGYAVLNLISQELYFFDTNYTHVFDNFEDFVGKFKESKGRLIKVSRKEPLRAQLEYFVNSVKNGRAPLVSPEEAISALRTAVVATETIRLKKGRA